MPALLLAAALTLGPADSLLVSADWLARHQSDRDLVVLHVAMARADYDRAHITGARYVDPHRFMGMGAPGVELPPAAEITKVLGELGITPESRIVFYGDTWMTPRVFLALEFVGLGDRSSLLDGGLEAWRGKFRPTSTMAPEWTATHPTFTPHPEIVVSADWLKAHLDDRDLVLLDGRSAGEYSGSDTSEGLPRSGHIPGGVNLPWDETFTRGPEALNGTTSPLRPPDALRKLLAAAGVRDGATLVTYCTVGLRASHLYFVARLLGYRPRLYDGSMSEWSRRSELPMVKGPSPR